MSKAKYKFIRDIFSEKTGGKYSSKKIWGHIFCTLVGVTYVMDGWHFYKINNNLFDSMLIAGVTLLGLTTFSSIFGKKKSESTSDTPPTP